MSALFRHDVELLTSFQAGLRCCHSAGAFNIGPLCPNSVANAMRNARQRAGHR